MIESVLYYLYHSAHHVQTSGKKLPLKFFLSFCSGCLLTLLGKGQDDSRKRSTGKLSLYPFSIHNMKNNLSWEHRYNCKTCSTWQVVEKYISFSPAVPTVWVYCCVHATLLWFSFQVGTGSECLSSVPGSLQSFSIYFGFHLTSHSPHFLTVFQFSFPALALVPLW